MRTQTLLWSINERLGAMVELHGGRRDRVGADVGAPSADWLGDVTEIALHIGREMSEARRRVDAE